MEIFPSIPMQRKETHRRWRSLFDHSKGEPAICGLGLKSTSLGHQEEDYGDSLKYWRLAALSLVLWVLVYFVLCSAPKQHTTAVNSAVLRGCAVIQKDRGYAESCSSLGRTHRVSEGFTWRGNMPVCINHQKMCTGKSGPKSQEKNILSKLHTCEPPGLANCFEGSIPRCQSWDCWSANNQ